MLKAVTHFIQQSWLLVVSAFFFGLALAIANAAWAPMIEQNRIDKLNDLMRGLLTEAETFQLTLEGIEVDLGKGRTAKSDIYKALAADGTCIGWAFDCEGAGFADKIELIVAVDENFRKLAGFDVLASNETPGFGDRIKLDYFRSQFAGTPAGKLELIKTGDDKKIDSRIVAVTGATVSSDAVVKIINNYLEQIKNQMKTKGLLSNAK